MKILIILRFILVFYKSDGEHITSHIYFFKCNQDESAVFICYSCSHTLKNENDKIENNVVKYLQVIENMINH